MSMDWCVHVCDRGPRGMRFLVCPNQESAMAVMAAATATVAAVLLLLLSMLLLLLLLLLQQLLLQAGRQVSDSV